MRLFSPAGKPAARALTLVALIAAALGAQTAPAPSGPVIRLAYRSLQPGEPIIVFLEADRSVKSAAVTFLGRTAELRPTRSSPTTRLSRTAPGNPPGADVASVFAFLGIDVQTKPGPYVLTVKLRKAGGVMENVRKDLLVVARTFPSTKLQF
ncbi:MAG: hypothetical protein ACXWFO_01460, partial [Candidatus Aminicenantales bacterium]